MSTQPTAPISKAPAIPIGKRVYDVSGAYSFKRGTLIGIDKDGMYRVRFDKDEAEPRLCRREFLCTSLFGVHPAELDEPCAFCGYGAGL
jgi:hypothetical protein